MLNPILAFSATRRMRSFRTLLILGAYIGCMLLIALILMKALFAENLYLQAGRVGLYGYIALIGVQMAMIVLMTPAMTSGAIAGERDRQTLELLLVTNTGSLQIVLGKMMETFAFLALLMLCGFPVMCLCLLTGAVTLGQILIGEVFLLATAFGTTALGIFASTLARTTVMSTILSYLMIAAVGVLTALPMLLGYPQWITDILYDARQLAGLTPAEAGKMLSPVLLINPGYGLTALLQGQTGLLSDYMEYREWGRLLATWKIMNAFGCQRAALFSAGAIAGTGLVLMGGAALLVRPRERKNHRRH